MSNKLKKAAGVVLASGVALAPAAFAQSTPTYDTTGISAVFTAVGVALGTIGAGYVAMKFGGKAWKWIANLAA